jgi:hypothetical protein
MRDARIITIYEGTTAIQANDLIGRKTAKEGGKSMQQLLADIAETGRAAQVRNAALKSWPTPWATASPPWTKPPTGCSPTTTPTRRPPRRLGALPQAHRHRRRRLADGPLRPDRRWPPDEADGDFYKAKMAPPPTSPST